MCIVDFMKIDGFVGKVSGENLYVLVFQVVDGICDSVVGFNLYLVVVVCGGGGYGMYLVVWLDGMYFVYVNGICGLDDCRDVMRFMDLFYVDCQVRLMSGEYFVDMFVVF